MPVSVPITESNHNGFQITPVLPVEMGPLLVEITERLGAIEERIDRVLAAYDEHRPLLEAYRRGGIPALRRAAKEARR